MDNLFDLTGRVAVVTGASSGLGTPSVKTVWYNDDSTAAYLYGCSSSDGIVQPARSGKPELRRSPRYTLSPSGELLY